MGKNRREFLVAKLTAGFAAAVQPILAQTSIHTNSAAADGGWDLLAGTSSMMRFTEYGAA
jgi:hypothetical protein